MARLAVAVTVAVILSLLAVSFSRPISVLPSLPDERDPLPSLTTTDQVDPPEQTEKGSASISTIPDAVDEPKQTEEDSTSISTDAVEYVVIPLHHLVGADLIRDEFGFSLRLPFHRRHHRHHHHHHHHPCKHHHNVTDEGHDEDEKAELVESKVVEKEEMDGTPGADVTPKADEHDVEKEEEELEKKWWSWWMENGSRRHRRHHHHHHHRCRHHHHHHGDRAQEEGGLKNFVQGLFERF